MGICAGLSGGFLQIAGEALAVTGSYLPCGATSSWSADCGNGRIDAFVDGTLNPDARAVSKGTGRREGHGKNGKVNSETGSQSVASVLMVNRWAMRPTKVL